MYNFAGILDHNLGLYPDKVVLTCGKDRLTNRQLSDRVHALAASLRDRGIGRGQFVAILMNNHNAFVEALLAVNRVGAAFLLLNCRLAPPEWQYMLENSDAVGIICDAEYRPSLDAVLPHLPSLRHRVCRGGDALAGWDDYEGLLSERRGQMVALADVGAQDLHRMMYTSGTSARPKGVPITHGNVMSKNLTHCVDFQLSKNDICLVSGPLYHVGGLDIPGLDTFYAGGSLVIMPKFDAAEALRLIQDEHATCTWWAPMMINRILQAPDLKSYDLSTMRLVVFGGEKTPRSLIENLCAAFPNAWLSDCYGMTETTSGDTFNDAAHMLSKVGSVGRPFLHVEVRIMAEDGSDVPPRALGEIVLRSPKLTGGYWRDEAATIQAFRNGWFHTGDVGWIDEEGYLYLEDRKKDMIISGGENIASAEVERTIYEHQDVFEAAVVAMSHPVWGQVPRAFVVKNPGTALAAEDLKDFCRQRLAKFKVPAEIVFVDALPRTGTGKVLKRDLREWATPARG